MKGSMMKDGSICDGGWFDLTVVLKTMDLLQKGVWGNDGCLVVIVREGSTIMDRCQATSPDNMASLLGYNKIMCLMNRIQIVEALEVWRVCQEQVFEDTYVF